MKSPVVRKAGLSPALVAKLNAMSPEERETAAEVASKLIQLRQAQNGHQADPHPRESRAQKHRAFSMGSG